MSLFVRVHSLIVSNILCKIIWIYEHIIEFGFHRDQVNKSAHIKSENLLTLQDKTLTLLHICDISVHCLHFS